MAPRSWLRSTDELGSHCATVIARALSGRLLGIGRQLSCRDRTYFLSKEAAVDMAISRLRGLNGLPD